MPARESDRTTPPRAAMTQALARAYKSMLAGEDRIELVHDLLVDFLEPRLRQIYDTFETMHAQGYTSMVSADVADLLGVKQHDASTMLKTLWEYGLLERIEERDDNARWFVYGLPGFSVYE